MEPSNGAIASSISSQQDRREIRVRFRQSAGLFPVPQRVRFKKEFLS
jgi:hypothetical protein